MSNHHLRFPPDSTGKRVAHVTYIDIDFDAGVNDFKIGDSVVGSISGVTGKVMHRRGNTTAGAVYLILEPESVEAAVIGETLNVLGVVFARVTNVGIAYYNQAVVAVGANNPLYGQQIDARGQASVRFAEGSPSLDAFGNLRTSSANILGGYEYSAISQADLFTDNVATGGLVTYDPTGARTVLSSTGGTGSSATRTTNRYHFYQPGVGNLIITTLAHGDTGKANNVRRWGYFDARNGLFWQLTGTTLQVVVRSDTSGVVVDTVVSRTDWNGDHVDGTGTSGMTIDITKANFYWIDYAWLGVGTARFGILAPDGSRWACHTFENPNSNVGPYMATGTLPVRYENFNTGSTSGTSELNLICSAVYAESQTKYVFWRYAVAERLTPVTVTTNTPIFSIRPKLEVVPGKPNRTGLYPESLEVFVTGGTVKVQLSLNPVLTNDSWTLDGGGAAEADIGATVATGGSAFHTCYFGPGVSSYDLTPFYETNDEGLHVLADSSGAYTLTLLATKIDGTTVTMSATLNHRELN